MKNRRTALIALLTILLLALPPAPARADVAPPPMPMVGGLGNLEYQKTNVEMRSERVEMELAPYRIEDGDTVFYHRAVTVNAWFVMRNTGSQDETMQVAFPLDDMNVCHNYGGGVASYTYLDFMRDSFEAQVNGQHVDTTPLTTDFPHAAEDYCDAKLNWAGFNVTFPTGEDTLIRVSYRMDNMGADALFNVGYTLETGAAWKGAIGEAVIVFRFPSVVEDFIMPATTPGYQVMQNEIYWRYENLEPAHKDNISVAFVDPFTWADIRDARHRIKANPRDDAAWATLAESYSRIAHIHGPNIRSEAFNQRAYTAYREGLKANPNSPALNAGYADLYYTDCCFYGAYEGKSLDAEMKVVQAYVVKALTYDPGNEKALELLRVLNEQDMALDVTLGPTFTPAITDTPTVTATDAQTPTPTYTRRPTITPVPTETQTARPSQTAQPSQTPTQAAASTSVTGTSVAAAAATRAATRAAPNGGPSSVVATVVSLVAVVVVFGVLILGRLLRSKGS